jgi:uncharacterized iron-regulated membrane protein
MMAKVWARIHKWLALVMAVQILFWFLSGLFFAAFPIERVRSEHAVAEQKAVPLPFGTAADGLLRLGSAGVTGDRIEISTLLDRPVALVSYGDSPPILYDLASGRPLSPIPMTLAVRIAEADHRGDHRASRVVRIDEASSEYRGRLPAWRVDFDDGARRSLYVAADSGAVTARRSQLWRVYDFLWGLHIMDWSGRQDFNSPLLVGATLLGLVVILTGLFLLPFRLGRLRRKQASSGS